MKLYLLKLGVMRKMGAPVPGYLIKTDSGANILVDTGFPRTALADGPIEVAPEHDLVDQLAAVGVSPADVSTVICTHLDPDHSGNHDLFEAAEFVVQRSHYELATSGSVPRLEQSRPRWDLPQLKYRLVDGDCELLPGIELIETSGHITGHQSILVRLPEDGPVLLAADAIPVSVAMDPDNRPIFPFDLDEPAVRESTRKLVDLAERENALIVHGHDGPQWQTLRIAPEYYS
jgi:N-acyl homoserine lactone hydrolase